MGAGQSRSAEGVDEVKASYYELLGVQRQATEEEIKKAYRRKALELHPDRNYGNEEAATKTFAEVQSAYEILSDPQERAWYDSHESAILRGDDRTEQDAPTYSNVRVTSADDLARIVRKWSSNVEFSDAPSGFFGFVRETFEQLAKEEEIAAQYDDVDVPEYPTFGHKDDEYDDVVKRFYAAWSSFSTVKSFSWRDRYKLSEAPDRFYRRRMEKENKSYRQEGIKEFNEAVRSLVAFVKKRDPRYVPSTQSEAERQKVLRDAAAAQAARARAANLEKLTSETVPEWAKYREPEELEESEEEEEEQHVFECVACNKVFKSENQWEAHEKSKKHQKAVYALQKKMRKEDAHLDIQEADLSSGVATPDVEDEEDQDMHDHVADEVDNRPAGTKGLLEDDEEAAKASDNDTNIPESLSEEHLSQSASVEGSGSEDSDYASVDAIRQRLQDAALDTPLTAQSDMGDAPDGSAKASSDDVEQPSEKSQAPKMGKAAQKRAKRAAAAAASDGDTASEASNANVCASCKAGFPSRTRLFQHIKDHPGHAELKAVSGGKGKKGKGKR